MPYFPHAFYSFLEFRKLFIDQVPYEVFGSYIVDYAVLPDKGMSFPVYFYRCCFKHFPALILICGYYLIII